jgi:hypothetical protein
MIRFYDYAFYRVFQKYVQWKDDQAFTLALGYVVILQNLLILDVQGILSIMNIFPRHIPDNRILALPILITTWYFNNKRYASKHVDIIQHYDSHPDPYRKRNGYLVLLAMIIEMLIPMVIGYMRHNLGYDI